MVVSMGSFVASDSCMKLALPHAPLFELMLMRGLVSLAVCLGLILVMGQQASIVRMFDKWLVARGVLPRRWPHHRDAPEAFPIGFVPDP